MLRCDHKPLKKILAQTQRDYGFLLLSCFGLLFLVLPCFVMAGEGDGTQASVEQTWLSVRLNGQKQTDTLLCLRQKNGELWLRQVDLEQWRLNLPHSAPLIYDEENYYSLNHWNGLSYHINDANVSLDVTADASLFATAQLTGRREIPPVTVKTPLGAFLNYDVSGSYTNTTASGNAFLEAVVFNQHGVLQNTALVQNFADRERNLIRLATSWTQDDPNSLVTIKIGDAISSSLELGGAMRFAGFQKATHFNLQPSLITYPLPAVSGEASLPSTVDILVDNAKKLRQQVPIGPFVIQDVPLLTGQGQARVVIRDVLGREKVLYVPYHVFPSLLKVGLKDYSYELGVIRENIGIHSQDYGRFMMAGTYRVGITPYFTSEAHAELLQQQQTAVYGGILLWPMVGTIQALVAGSYQEEYGSGYAAKLGFNRQYHSMGFGISSKLTSSSFFQLGTTPENKAAKQESSIFISKSTEKYGSFSANYLTSRFENTNDDLNMLLISHGFSFGRWGAISLSASRQFGASAQTYINASFSMPLGNGTSASMQIKPNSNQQELTFQRSLSSGVGMGYGLGIVRQENSLSYDGELSYQNEMGSYGLGVATTQQQTSWQSSIRGSIALLQGNIFLSRQVNGSFGVVEIPDYANIRVYENNQLIGRTNQKGVLLLPRLRPYQKNTIRVEQADLPFDAQIGNLQTQVIPPFRSGVVVPFAIKRLQGVATLTIVLDDGTPLPAGATAKIIGGNEEFPVGFQGELYVTGLQAENVLDITWKTQHCQLHVAFSQTADPLPDLGHYRCVGVRP